MLEKLLSLILILLELYIISRTVKEYNENKNVYIIGRTSSYIRKLERSTYIFDLLQLIIFTLLGLLSILGIVKGRGSIVYIIIYNLIYFNVIKGRNKKVI